MMRGLLEVRDFPLWSPLGALILGIEVLVLVFLFGVTVEDSSQMLRHMHLDVDQIAKCIFVNKVLLCSYGFIFISTAFLGGVYFYADRYSSESIARSAIVGWHYLILVMSLFWIASACFGIAGPLSTMHRGWELDISVMSENGVNVCKYQRTGPLICCLNFLFLAWVVDFFCNETTDELLLKYLSHIKLRRYVRLSGKKG